MSTSLLLRSTRAARTPASILLTTSSTASSLTHTYTPPTTPALRNQRAGYASQFGPPNETTMHPPGGHPHNKVPKEHRAREGHNKYRPPEDLNARAHVEDKAREYKERSRRVTLALVAAPIALVTSYVMWNRVVAGNDKRKTLGEGKS